jgi:hypothetical protein
MQKSLFLDLARLVYVSLMWSTGSELFPFSFPTAVTISVRRNCCPVLVLVLDCAPRLFIYRWILLPGSFSSAISWRRFDFLVHVCAAWLPLARLLLFLLEFSLGPTPSRCRCWRAISLTVTGPRSSALLFSSWFIARSSLAVFVHADRSFLGLHWLAHTRFSFTAQGLRICSALFTFFGAPRQCKAGWNFFRISLWFLDFIAKSSVI